jgi:hypothetical protein
LHKKPEYFGVRRVIDTQRAFGKQLLYHLDALCAVLRTANTKFSFGTKGDGLVLALLFLL